jgi:SAM-dependent methyltransferase
MSREQEQPPVLSAKDWYNRFAEDFFQHKSSEEASPFHAYYEKPAMFAALPDVTGQAVLCIGCGSGEECRELKQRGAEKVVGTDISQNLVEIARTQVPECEFEVMDMQALDFALERFDCVYSSLALHYAKDWEAVMKGVYPVLKPGGIFLFSTGHPFMESFVWRQEDDGARTFREFVIEKDRVEKTVNIRGDYMTAGVFPVKFHVTDEHAIETLHLPLGDMFKSILSAGFQLVDFIEPLPTQQFQDLDPMNYEMLRKIPTFVIFKLRKP